MQAIQYVADKLAEDEDVEMKVDDDMKNRFIISSSNKLSKKIVRFSISDLFQVLMILRNVFISTIKLQLISFF